jgi:hypothetical protein
MPRAWRAVCVAALLLSTISCASSTSAPTANSSALHGEVSDPVGDALPVPNVPNPPDLVHGTVDVASGNITFTIQFAPGSLDRQTTRLTIELDTDLNPSTGIPAGPGLGIDYVVDMWASPTQTLIEKAIPTGACTQSSPCYTTVGTAPLSLTTDGMQATVPLSLLGSGDGRLAFRVFAYAYPPLAGSTTMISDVMPDLTLPPGRVQ